MNRKRELYMLGSLFIASFVATTATVVFAAHQWSCWHWNHGNIKITNAATGYWNTIIGDEFNDWDVGTCVSFGSGTEITGDSGFYGNTGWLGIARLLTVDSGACLILSAEALLNQTYLDGGTYPETADRHVTCQEIGHTLGLGHDRGQTTCMNDQVLTNPFFRQHDVDLIASITLNCNGGCVTNTDCDDLDPCTTDVCTGGSCSNTPISCPTGQTCNGGICEGQGACCTGTACAINSPSGCSAAGGSYLGDGSVCGSGSSGTPTVYQSSPNVVIPDGGGSANPATDTINVPTSATIGDVNVDLTITHTWVGDVTVTVSHLGTSVTIVDRPGVPGSTYGCSNDNYSGILLDDEGTGGTMESQCALNLSSPPNYTPNNPLSAFDGLDAAGVWTITVYDSVSADGGTLNTWSLHIDGVGSNPCSAPGCTTNAQCDDGVFCNGAETCAGGTCQAGTAVNCSDGVACTNDSCNEATASCNNVPSNANCDDGLACNGVETCDAVLDCQAGTTVNCNDGVACTTDACNEPGGTCSNTPSNAACDDGLFCNGAETCDAVLNCQAGTAPNCNDGVACTVDSCNNATGSCDNVPNNASCDDGLACNGVETCDAVLNCQAGTAVNCNDGVGCTTDSCNEPGGTCTNAPSNAVCDDGLFCNGAEVCNITLDCQAGGNPCVGQGCDEVTNTCTAGGCTTNANCDDGNVCTDDVCNAGVCQNTNNTAACNDGLFCNGIDICQAGVCTPNTISGVTNGTFDSAASWTNNLPVGGSITYPTNLNVVGSNAGTGGFTWASQGAVTVSGANLEFDLISYASTDIADWDYPVFYLNGTYYGLNSNGTLGVATTGGSGNGGTVDNAGQVTVAIHYVVNIDALAGNAGPHTIGFGVHSVDAAFGAGTAVFDNVIPGGGPIDPCPGQTCDEVNNICVP